MRARLHVALLLALLALLAHGGAAADLTTTEEEYADAGDSLSREDDNTMESMEQPEDLPVIACEKGGMCTCSACKTCVKKAAGEMNCENVTLKGDVSLDTANLHIRLQSNPNFVAYAVNLRHNNIDILRRGQVLPGREAEVEYLDCSHNHIEDVEPHTLDSFSKLAKLKLSYNRLRDNEISVDWLTPELGASLHQLHLDFNYLVQLDDGIFDNLASLTKLVLDGNKGIKLTARTFGSKLLKLKTLSLDKCGLEALPDKDLFAQLPSLTDVSLSGNPLHSVPLALQGVPKLSILAMSETPLDVIPTRAFAKLTTLTKLYLRRMPRLTALQDCAFCRLASLETLDLSFSARLSTIHPNALGGDSDTEVPLDTLQYLHISNCNLSTLSEKLVLWSGLKRLGVGGNPLTCDCSLKWLIAGGAKQQKLLRKLVGTDQPTCAAPEPLKDMTLDEAAGTADFTCGGTPVPPDTGVADGGGGRKMTLALVLIGLVGTLFIVGAVYARRGKLQALYFSGANGAGSGWPSVSSGGGGGDGPTLGYANLPRRGGAARPDSDESGDDDRLERDFRQPEFV